MLIALQILGGFVLLIVGSEVLIRGASNLAALLGMTPLVIGLTVVAFGTSSPELAVSIQSVFSDSADVAVGNAVGSNTLNVLLVLGLSALLLPLAVKSQIVKLDVPVMIAATIALWLIGMDGQISRLEGFIFVTVLVVYIAFLIRIARRETRLERKKTLAAMPEAEAQALLDEAGTSAKTYSYYAFLVVAGLIVLGVGCRLFVNGSVELARIMKVSELLIGLTVVSIGTSLPELVTTVVASIRGERDMAVGNIVGSNIFNILCVLGVTASVSPTGLPVAAQAINFDIPVTLATALICLPIFFNGGTIARWEGLVMLLLYGAYMTYLLMNAYDVPSKDGFEKIMLYVVGPITGLLLIGSTALNLRSPKPLSD